MKRASARKFVYYQFLILGLFVAMLLLDEIADLPHLLFGDPPIGHARRFGEISIELTYSMIIIVVEILFIEKLLREIKVLEGFLPICANCKKIRTFDKWEPLEQYISKHSLADFTHSICPECHRKLYPELHPKERVTAET